MAYSNAWSEDWPPGSAEYLSTRLSGPDHSCPHPLKLKAGIQSKIPSRLGFFHASDEDLSYLDTEKLCQECYDEVVPNGFLTWSVTYWDAGLNASIDGARYHPRQPTGMNPRWFPSQLQAGAEMFGSALEDFPPTLQKGSQDKVHRVFGYGHYDKRQYDERILFIPKHEAEEAWRYLKWAKMPFYVDILHLNPPWKSGLPKREQEEENNRVAQNNGAAYLGAVAVINAVPEGGYGPYTASEHRIAEVGSYRLVPLGTFDHPSGGDTTSDVASINSGCRSSLTIQLSIATDIKNEMARKAVEADPHWFPWLERLLSKNPETKLWLYPSKLAVDKVTKKAIGTTLKPTADEVLRRQYDAERHPTQRPWILPDPKLPILSLAQRVKIRLSKHRTGLQAVDPSSTQILSSVTPVTWVDKTPWVSKSMPKGDIPRQVPGNDGKDDDDDTDDDDDNYDDGLIRNYIRPLAGQNAHLLDPSGSGWLVKRRCSSYGPLQVKPPIMDLSIYSKRVDDARGWAKDTTSDLNEALDKEFGRGWFGERWESMMIAARAGDE